MPAEAEIHLSVVHCDDRMVNTRVHVATVEIEARHRAVRDLGDSAAAVLLERLIEIFQERGRRVVLRDRRGKEEVLGE